jgi:hypothetical protein
VAVSPQQDGVFVPWQLGKRAAIAIVNHDPVDVAVSVARNRAQAPALHETKAVQGLHAYHQSRARAHYYVELLRRESGEEVAEPIGKFADVARLRLADQFEISHVYIAPGRRVFQPGALLNPA